jgi:hypothetical protein
MIDQQIRIAQERGDFDDLPGMGKPLPGWGGQDDDLWWVKEFVRREGISAEAMLPTSLRLAREVERLPEEVSKLRSEQAVRAVVDDLNRRIAEYRRAPSGPHVALRPVDAEPMLAQWRASQRPGAVAGVPAPPAAPPPEGPPLTAAGEQAPPADRPPAPARRRWFGRRR